MADITCIRCGRTEPQLGRPPLRSPLGERIHGSIGSGCWAEWLRYQTSLINHYGLDVREKDARDLLTRNMEAFLFDAGPTEEIDSSKQGTVEW